ncbi:hypothetical protein OF83DRAFT_1127544 [Amylostereum chailletii]|nr:hypothetical protein OF83DRAFT_1127544 [Amylostereum chailletii]
MHSVAPCRKTGVALENYSIGTSLGNDSENFEKLFVNELRWRDRQVFLQSKGYLLRPRLRPGWTPSWKTNGRSPIRCEDFLELPVSDR